MAAAAGGRGHGTQLANARIERDGHGARLADVSTERGSRFTATEQWPWRADPATDQRQDFYWQESLN